MIRRALLIFLFPLLALSTLAPAEALLPPTLAFRPAARALDGKTIEVRFAIAEGYHLYRDKFRFSSATPGVTLGTPVLPKGKVEIDDAFGKVEVYYQEAAIRLPVGRNTPGAFPVSLEVVSQGCADQGVCYPPQKQSLQVDLPDVASSPAAAPQKNDDESGRISQLLRNAGPWMIVLSFFGFGLLLAFSPCVFPMLPILSGIIVGAGRDGHGISHARGFALSLAYVLGMALSYAAVGAAAGITGTLLSADLQTPWALGGFALVFVLLALSMFGFYELQVPPFLQSKISEEAARLKGGSLPAVALMGALSALIVGPCVAPPLAGALLYIGQSGDAVLGGIALFFMALGMGAPLLAVGLSAGTLLPKTGPWMVSVKKAFGVFLLATAVWIVSPVVPPALPMAAWALLAIGTAIQLRAIDPLPPHCGHWPRFWKGVGVALLIAGTALLIGALSGAKDPLQPLAGLRLEKSETLPFERVRTVNELAARLKTDDRSVMLDFYADWCVSCKEMARFTFSDPRVRQALSGWTLLRADVTANSDADKAPARPLQTLRAALYRLLQPARRGNRRRPRRRLPECRRIPHIDCFRRTLNRLTVCLPQRPRSGNPASSARDLPPRAQDSSDSRRPPASPVPWRASAEPRRSRSRRPFCAL